VEGELRFINSSGKKNPLNTLESPTLNLNPTSPIYIVCACVYTYKHTCIAFALIDGGEAMQQGPVMLHYITLYIYVILYIHTHTHTHTHTQDRHHLHLLPRAEEDLPRPRHHPAAGHLPLG